MHISFWNSTRILGASLPKLRSRISVKIVKGTLCAVDYQMCKLAAVSSRCALPLCAACCAFPLLRAHVTDV